MLLSVYRARFDKICVDVVGKSTTMKILRKTKNVLFIAPCEGCSRNEDYVNRCKIKHKLLTIFQCYDLRRRHLAMSELIAWAWTWIDACLAPTYLRANIYCSSSFNGKDISEITVTKKEMFRCFLKKIKKRKKGGVSVFRCFAVSLFRCFAVSWFSTVPLILHFSAYKCSIQASRDKSWNVKWTTGSLDPWFSGLRIECQLSFLRKQKERVKRQYHVY